VTKKVVGDNFVRLLRLLNFAGPQIVKFASQPSFKVMTGSTNSIRKMLIPNLFVVMTSCTGQKKGRVCGIKKQFISFEKCLGVP
jgi:hypothetical protein